MRRNWIALARALPPGVVARRAADKALRPPRAAAARRRDRARPTFATDIPAGPLSVICDDVPAARLAAQRHWIAPAANLFLDHRFDLLGSGWVRVEHGVGCAGVAGDRYPPGPSVTPDREGRWLEGRVNRSNLPLCQEVWRLIDDDHTPIDWQIDFKSGHRWREDCWYADIAFGRLPGVDVKIPWELAHMQHLIVLAWAHGLARADSDAAAARAIRRAFRNQLLDFIATNPPRFGVNWRCPMDVAIRAANWAVGYGLMRAAGGDFDAEFEQVLKRSLVEHGRYILTHLEFYPEGRANHYLADVTGLAFIAATLPASPETDGWLAFAWQELAGETAHQFTDDGANFEGSTCYHRLSAEMAVYATALVLGLPESRRAAFDRDHRAGHRTRPRRPLGPRVAPPGAEHFTRLARAGEFTLHVTKPSGLVAQIGDNDSGRMFKPHPVYLAGGAPELPREVDLDHRGVVAAIAALVGREDLADFAGRDRLDAALVTALARGRSVEDGSDRFPAARARIAAREGAAIASSEPRTVEIVAPGGNLRENLRLFGYPDFGLWLYRSDRLFLAVRCGSPPGGGRAGGGHAHNDQLAIELAVDGEDWITDPGSYLYCAPSERRNAWRSVAAHAAPRWDGREPGRLDLGDFILGETARSRCLRFDARGFAGEHWGFGSPVRREIAIGPTGITIRDFGLPAGAGRADPERCVGRDATRRRFAGTAPFSPGYGRLDRDEDGAP